MFKLCSEQSHSEPYLGFFMQTSKLAFDTFHLQTRLSDIQPDIEQLES